MTRIEAIEIPVTDLGRSLQFYAALLGIGPANLSRTQGPGARALFEFAAYGASIQLMATAEPAPPSQMRLVLSIAPNTPIEQFLDDLELRGGTRGHSHTAPGFRSIGVQDPDGNQLELAIRT